MSDFSRLGLGTAQWGMNYGIKNVDGKPHSSEVGKILQSAKEHGINLLDTAFAYGKSEQLLGSLADQIKSFRVVTKTFAISKAKIVKYDVETVLNSFHNSLKKLKAEKVYGLLVHHTHDILRDGGDRLWDALQELKGSFLVEKLGVSVYDPNELENVLTRFRPDMVQLPFNIYDQRFLHNGMLRALQERGIEVHSRSAFLQGLLLIDADHLPERFQGIRDHQKQLYFEIQGLGLSPLRACLNFSLIQPNVDRTIVGCETYYQFEEIVLASKIEGFDCAFFERFQIADPRIINPSLWQS